MFIGFFAVLFCGDLKVGVLVPDAHSAAVTAAVRSHRRRTTEAAGCETDNRAQCMLHTLS